jgi:hypothetical protein
MDFDKIDWTICVLCQKNYNTGLVQQRNSTYNTLATNWQRWEDECDTFPFDIRSNTIPPNTSLCEVLLKNSARWHKVCELKINENNIARNLKRKSKSEKAVSEKCTKRFQRD